MPRDAEMIGKRYDVIVIGAGLSGVTVGLALQQYGLKVAILERAGRWGGLCGTFHLDGYEFVIACNDFGKGMEKILKDLNVAVEFHKPVTLVFHEGRQYAIPPKVRDLLPGWRSTWQIAKYLRKVIRHKTRTPDEEYLEVLVNNTIRAKKLNNLLKVPAYFMGVRPAQFKVEELKSDYAFNYGYSEPTTPVGGPQVLVDEMVAAFRAKGEIFLDTEVSSVEGGGYGKRVNTSSGVFVADEVVKATGERMETAKGKLGMPLSMFLIAIRKSFTYPGRVHTMAHFPGNPEKWFGELDEGLCPEEFGFHIFRSDLPDQGETYTANIFFYMPRGMDDPDDGVVAKFEEYIFRHLESMLPGISEAIVYKRFMSAGEFARRHGLSSRVMPRITPHGVQKPENYDKGADMFLAGNAVFPPGDHAGAALLSGVKAANLLLRKIIYSPVAEQEWPENTMTKVTQDD